MVASRQVARGPFHSDELGTDQGTTDFLGRHTSGPERALASRSDAARSGLVLTALRRAVGTITGSVSRDVRVIRTMAAAPTWAQILVARAPGTFR